MVGADESSMFRGIVVVSLGFVLVGGVALALGVISAERGLFFKEK